MIRLRHRLVSLGALGCALLSPALAGAQGAPPPPAPPPALPPPAPPPAPAPSPSPDDPVRRLEQRVLELEARLQTQEKHTADAQKAEDDKKAEAKKAEEKKAEDEKAKPTEPFAFGDFSWAPASYGSNDRPLSWGPFTGEFRVDVAYHYDFSNPKDHTISGSSEVFRSNEFQLTQLGFGGDFLYKNVQARLMTQFGMYSETTPRNDASPGQGQWDLADAYRYLAEAYGGYHIDALHGINIQAGIFMSYVGLWSYYNYDNWTYQPSYVSSNTPWFFNGMRIQIFPSDKLKIEPWIVNGWQSYGKFNEAPGLGLQILWKPVEYLTVLGNQYFGTDTLGTPGRKRIHTDDSIMMRFYNNPGGGLSKVAASLTLDAGCEFGPGTLDKNGKPTNTVTGFGAGPVSCGGGNTAAPDQFFLGFMSYARAWFWGDRLGLTVGGGAITNPGRYLVLLPPINGATAFTGSPYFSESPGNPFKAWDMQVTFDYMPEPFLTWRFEYNHRAADQPYFTGPNGVTPPGGDNGNPGALITGWSPDLVKTEDRLTAALLLKL
jgi:Putative beta-barrel porin-2, OmpL-like. bbp2